MKMPRQNKNELGNDPPGADATDDRKAGLQSVDRAISVLEFLSIQGWSGVTAVAQSLGIHKSTAYRLLATLKERGLVEQDMETDRYRLGMGVVFLASTVVAELDVVRAAQPVCKQVGEQTGETVTIAMLAGDEAITVDQFVSSSSVLNVDWTGRRLPLHCSSDGKVLLAHLPPERQHAILLEPLTRFTDRTIVDPVHLAAQLQDIRREGFGYSIEELEIGLNGVAAPICSAGGTAVAAISVSGPAFRLSQALIPVLGQVTKDAGMEISQRLGFRAHALRTADGAVDKARLRPAGGA
ncbi:MAG: IclR family transcriptional regulator [Chloroflexota bacterium]